MTIHFSTLTACGFRSTYGVFAYMVRVIIVGAGRTVFAFLSAFAVTVASALDAIFDAPPICEITAAIVTSPVPVPTVIVIDMLT